MKKKGRDVRKAVALHYDAEKHQAPKVVAKGSGIIADKILEAARKHKVPIHEDPQLIEMMNFFHIGEAIPEAAYHAVAEILAFIYRINDAYQK